MLLLNGVSHQFPKYFFCPPRATYLFSCSGHMPFDPWTLPYSLRVFWVLTVLLCPTGHLETLLLCLQGLFPQQREVLFWVCSQHSFRDIPCLRFSFRVLFIYLFISFLCLLNFYHLTSRNIYHLDTRHREHAQSCPLMPTVSQCLCLPCISVILTITCLFALLLIFFLIFLSCFVFWWNVTLSLRSLLHLEMGWLSFRC